MNPTRSPRRTIWHRSLCWQVGKLDELVVDRQSGEITNVLMREGHLWGNKDLVIPVSAIDWVDADTVYLKLDKADV